MLIRKILGLVRQFLNLKSRYLVGGKYKTSCKYNLCVIANGNVPTLQLSIIEPLVTQASPQLANIHLITESIIKRRGSAEGWFNIFLQKNKITHVVFCRYSGLHYQEILQQCSLGKVPTLYCIDDDLLNVPKELGEAKYLFHNSPSRLNSVRWLLNQVDLVYCSNPRLKARLHGAGVSRPIEVLKVFCAGKVLKVAELKPVTKIGYMGFDHEHDLKLVLPALVMLLQKYDHLSFELFGKIPKPRALEQFGNRVRCIPSESNYQNFKTRLVELKWDVGICPLVDTPFNQVKNNNKWVEYTSAGIAVLASKSVVYNDCCNDLDGSLVGDHEWYIAVDSLVSDKLKAYSLASDAQNRLNVEYSYSKLNGQLCSMLDSLSKACDSESIE